MLCKKSSRDAALSPAKLRGRRTVAMAICHTVRDDAFEWLVMRLNCTVHLNRTVQALANHY